jgi:hypothetical protein
MDELDITISALKVCGNSDASFCSTGGEWVVVVMKHLSQLSMQVKNQSLVRPVRRSRAALGAAEDPGSAKSLKSGVELCSLEAAGFCRRRTPRRLPVATSLPRRSSGEWNWLHRAMRHSAACSAFRRHAAAGISPASMEAASPAVEIGHPNPDWFPFLRGEKG